MALFNVINLVLLLININICRKNPWKGIISYLFLSTLLPDFKFGEFGISYTIFSFIPIIIFYFIYNKIYIKFPRLLVFIILYFILLILSTLKSFLFQDFIINSIGLFASFRMLFLILLASDLRFYDKEYICNWFLYILLINFIMSLVQLVVPSSVHFFYDLYWKPSMTPLENALKVGRFYRAMGTFGTPVILGALSLISSIIFMTQIMFVKKLKKYYYGIILSIAIGIMALSKIFIVGIPVMLIIIFLIHALNVKSIQINKVSFGKRIIVFSSIIIILFFSISLMKKLGLPIDWYLKYILKPFETLSTRYSDHSGNLIPVINMIKNNIIIGTGDVYPGKIFLGDSSYIVILFSTGCVGLFVLLIVWLVMIYCGFKLGRLYYSYPLVLIALLLVFIGSNLYNAPLGMITLVYAMYPIVLYDKKIILTIKV